VHERRHQLDVGDTAERASFGFLSGNMAQLQREDDVVEHGPPRQKVRILEDKTDAGAAARPGARVFDGQRPSRDRLQPRDEAQQRGLATP
jgi:hypothetical protein